MRAPVALLASALTAAVCAAACATDRGYGAITTTWDQATPTEHDASKDPAPTGRLTATQAAAAYKTAAACAAGAKAYWAKSPHAGAVLLKACVHRDDFIDLDVILRGPWAADMRKAEPLQLIAAEVIAHRGGFVEADTGAARAAGIPLYDVTTASEQGDKAVGKLVLVRGAVDAVAKEKIGGSEVTVARVQESSWVDPDATDEESGALPVREDVDDTGRSVFARVENRDPRFTRDHALVFAMRLDGPKKYKDEAGEEHDSLIGVAVGIYDAASRIRR